NYTYNDFVGAVNSLIEKLAYIEDLTPLKLELVVWPKMRLKLAVEAFYDQFKEGFETEDIKNGVDIKDLSLQEGIECIKELLDKKQWR
ncbi:MAG: hypothetical protein LUC41_04750, partial [Clostridiales bacterium]|nr:hypothetical protein [Clostridiales bacterium]